MAPGACEVAGFAAEAACFDAGVLGAAGFLTGAFDGVLVADFAGVAPAGLGVDLVAEAGVFVAGVFAAGVLAAGLFFGSSLSIILILFTPSVLSQ